MSEGKAMAIKVAGKIIAYSVVKPTVEAPKQASTVVQMHEKIERPSSLQGVTYKIKSPSLEAAVYVTINDIVLNKGTKHESRRPYEIFVNSKDAISYQWVTALTRLMSAVFRKGGDITFLVEELKAVFDPKGGYFQPGTGTFMPSVIAEIGHTVEKHLITIGILQPFELSAEQVTLIEQKKEKMGQDQFPNATQCPKCNQLTMIRMDGCDTCLTCGNSKCG